jgi:hypothetical protein
MMTLCFGVILAASSRMAVPTVEPGTDERQFAVRAVVDLYERAVNDQKLDLLTPHTDEAFSAVLVTGETATGLDELKTRLAKVRDVMGTGGRYRLAVATKPARILGDVAVIEGQTTEVVESPDGTSHRATGAWSAVCRLDGAWKLVRIHASIDPLDNPFMNEKARRPRRTASGGGLAVGLVVGLVVGLGIGRRRAQKA